MRTESGQPIVLPRRRDNEALWGVRCEQDGGSYVLTFFQTRPEACGIRDLNTAYPIDDSKPIYGKIIEATLADTIKIFMWLLAEYMPIHGRNRHIPQHDGFPLRLDSPKVALTVEDYLLLNQLVVEKEIFGGVTVPLAS